MNLYENLDQVKIRDGVDKLTHFVGDLSGEDANLAAAYCTTVLAMSLATAATREDLDVCLKEIVDGLTNVTNLLWQKWNQ